MAYAAVTMAMKIMVSAHAQNAIRASMPGKEIIFVQTVLLATCKLLLGRCLVVFAILVPTMQPMEGAQLALLVPQALRKVFMGRPLVMSAQLVNMTHQMEGRTDVPRAQ